MCRGSTSEPTQSLPRSTLTKSSSEPSPARNHIFMTEKLRSPPETICPSSDRGNGHKTLRGGKANSSFVELNQSHADMSANRAPFPFRINKSGSRRTCAKQLPNTLFRSRISTRAERDCQPLSPSKTASFRTSGKSRKALQSQMQLIGFGTVMILILCVPAAAQSVCPQTAFSVLESPNSHALVGDAGAGQSPALQPLTFKIQSQLPAAAQVALFLCGQGQDDRPMPVRLCDCSDNTCTSEQTASAIAAETSPMFSGNFIAEVQQGYANFTDFNIVVAQTNLRLGFYTLDSNDAIQYTDPCGLSGSFSIDSGKLAELRFDNPGTTGMCPYCKPGAFQVSAPIPIKIGLYDRFGNIMAYCSPAQNGNPAADCRLCERNGPRAANGLSGVTVSLRQGNRLVDVPSRSADFENGMASISDFNIALVGSDFFLRYAVNPICSNPQTTDDSDKFFVYEWSPAVGESFIGGTTGDSLALVNPQPVIALGQQPSDQSFFVRTCYDGFREDGSLVTSPPQEGLCKCDSCAKPTSVTAAVQNAVFLSGNLTASVNSDGNVVFTGIQTALARPDLRLLFYPFANNNVTSLPIRSDIFSVTSGRLHRLELLMDPSGIPGCRRCPTGVYLAGSPIKAVVVLFDAFDNVVGFCDASNVFCFAFSGAPVTSRLFRDGSDVTPTAGQQSVVLTVDGTANFTDMLVREANAEYYFVFRAEEKTFPGPVSTGIVEVLSQHFVVVSSSPTAIRAVGTGTIISADGEVFPEAPQIETVDEFGNRVVNDCSEDPNCALPGSACTKCDISSAPLDQGLQISVSLVTVGLLGNAQLSGTTTATTVQGVATFADLVLASIPSSPNACTCDTAGVCASCASCYPNGMQMYTLQFALPGLGLANLQVDLQPRVQRMNIIVQGEVQGVANEPFLIPMQVEALDCNSNRVTSTTADIAGALAPGGGGGILTGTLQVPLVEGLVVFTDLSLDLPGFYVVNFAYFGGATVNEEPSSAFSIGAPVVKFTWIASPESTQTVAGIPFEIQPRLQLIDANDDAASLSALTVTASIESDPGGQQPHNPVKSVLLGTTVVQAAEGEIRFFDLRLEKASVEQSVATDGFVLRFSQGPISIVTNHFDVVPAAWTGLFVPLQNQPTLSTAGTLLAVQPSVYLVDDFKNRIRQSQVPAGTKVDAWLLIGDAYATRVDSFSGNPPRLLRHSCSERCFGIRPTICFTCTNFDFDASAAFVQYNDLRVDIARTDYRLRFNASGFEVITDTFAVVNTVASTLSITDVDGSARADQVLSKQPISLLVDRFNNPITVEASGEKPQITAKLFTLSGRLPTLPPLPPVQGQAAGTICSLSEPLLRGTTNVNMSMGLGVFTDLMIVHAMKGYKLEISYRPPQGEIFRVNSTSIDVVAGDPAGLCALTLPRRCSENSPCLEPSEVVCVDKWGNVQRRCHLCGTNTETCDRFSIPSQFEQQCPPNRICVEVASAPEGATITSVPSKVYQGVAAVPFAVIGTGAFGGANFDELILSHPSPRVSLRFFTFLHDPRSDANAYAFEFITPKFNVTPAGPVIEVAQLTRTINQLEIKFNRPTNMNRVQGQMTDDTCQRELHPVFRASLGIPHACSWPSSSVLLVSFGDGAYINTSTRVMLSDLSMIMFSEFFEGKLMVSLPATTQLGIVVNGEPTAPVFPSLPGIIPVPDVQLSGLLSLGGCELINIDGSSSSGHVGRPFVDTEWSLDFVRSWLTQGIMSAGAEKEFLNRDIEFSNLLAEDENVVRVKLRPTAPIYPNSLVSITGLPGQQMRRTGCPFEEIDSDTTMPCFHNESLSCPAVEVTGPSAHLFVESKAQWSGTTLILKVKQMVSVLASTDCVIQFVMVNPPEPMLSEELAVEVTCEKCECTDVRQCADQIDASFPRAVLRLNCATKCQENVVFGITNYPLQVLSATISETTSVVSAFNTISVTIVPDAMLSARSTIVLRDMQGLRTPSGPICILGPSADKLGCTFNDGETCSRFPTVANWQQNAGTITVRVRSGVRIEAGEPIIFQFELENADQIQREDCLARSQLDCLSIIRPTVSLMSPDPDPGALEIPGFPFEGDVLGSGMIPDFDGVVSVDEGNTFQGVTNLLVIGFAVTVALPEGAIIDLDWSEAVGLADGPVLLHGTRSACFGWNGVPQFGSYNVSTMKLQIQVAASEECASDIQPRERLEVSFQVTNALQMQTERTVTVSVRFPGCSACRQGCSCGGQGKASLYVDGRQAVGSVLSAATEPRFVEVGVSETVTVAQEKNTISVQVLSSASLVGGSSKVTIVGLVGTSSPDSDALPLQLTGAAQPVTGSFRAASGTLVFDLLNTTDRFSVSFEVQNGDTAVASEGIFVSSDAQIDICGERISSYCDSGAYDSTRVISQAISPSKASGNILQFDGSRSFVNATISELTRVSGSYNIITIRIRTNCEIPAGPNTRVEISGLTNTRWPGPASSIIARGSMLELLPDCACHQCALDSCCTSTDLSVVSSSLFLWTYEGAGVLPFGSPAVDLTSAQEASGSWEPVEEGKLVLNVLAGRAVPADTDLIFSFSVQNPLSKPVLPAEPVVTIVSDLYTLGPVKLEGSVLSGDRDPFITRFTVREDNDIISNFNRLTVSFQVNFPVFSLSNTPVRVLMSSLAGYNLENGFVPLDGRDALKVAKTGYGNWSVEFNQMEFKQGVIMGNCLSLDSLDDCALIQPGHFDFSSMAQHEFSFIIKNTDVQLSKEIFPQLKVLSAEATTPSFPATSRPLSAANPRPVFLQTSLQQSSDVRLATNELTLSFQSNIAMYPGSTVTLRGMDNSASPSGSVPLSGSHANLFACQFNQGAGTVVLTVQEVLIDPKTEVEVSFRLINPAAKQTSRDIALKGLIVSPPVREDCSSPLLIPAYGLDILIDFTPVPNMKVFEGSESLTFSTAKIHESTRVSSAVNTITLTLVSKVDMREGSVITLLDVDSPVTSNPVLQITGPGRQLVGGTGDWSYNSIIGQGKLVLTLVQTLPVGEVVEVSFKLRNKGCYGIDSCPGKVVTIGANALRVGNELPAQLNFESAEMDGAVFGAGAHLSWITKTVTQGSSVNSAENRLVFALRPNAPLYGGTSIQFVGLYGSESRTCKVCAEEEPFHDRIPALGCSLDCLECPPERLVTSAGDTFTPCIPVFTTNNVQHPTFVINSQFIADDEMSETLQGGSLTLTVAAGQKLSELEDTEVVVYLKNAEEARYRDECSIVTPPEDHPEGRDCLRVRAEFTSICSEETSTGTAQETCELLEAPDGLATGKAVRVGRRIQTRTVPIDWYGEGLPDFCSDCVRPVDIVAVHQALASQDGLVLSDLAIATPSLQGLPTLVDGGLAFGEYTINLGLSNWVGGEGLGKITIFKEPPPGGKGRGPLGNENAKPAVFIKGLTERTPFRDQDVLLDAVGDLALCLAGAERESLSYRWSIACTVGYCEPAIDLNTAVQSPLVPTLLLPGGLLMAGTEYSLAVTASQFFLQSTAQVVVSVQFRPVKAVLAGVGQTGPFPFGRDTILDASGSIDPDASTTGFASADLEYSWGCRIQQEQGSGNSTDSRRVFVPCPEGTVKALETPGQAVFNSTFQELGGTYILSVNVSRPALPLAEDMTLGTTNGWFDPGTASSTLTLVPGEPVQVRAFVCDPSLLGSAALCEQPLLRNKVSSQEHVVLKAFAEPSSSGIITSYTWMGLSETLRQSMVLTTLTEQVLILQPKVFTLGHTVRLRCTSRDSNANDGFADISFSVNVPPLGGTLGVIPQNGTALETEFALRAEFWLSDPENLPLSYRFFFVATDQFGYDMPLSRSQTQEISSVLPAGPVNASNHLDVGVEVIDVIGDMTRVIKQVMVLPPPDDAESVQLVASQVLAGPIDRYLRLGAYTSAQGTVAGVGGVLNEAVEVCKGGEGTEACRLRQSTRTQLFLKLQDVTARVQATAAQLEDQGRVLSTITLKPEELDFALVQAIADYVDWSLEKARVATLRAAVIADVYASVADHLFQATQRIVGAQLRRGMGLSAVNAAQEAEEGEWTRSRQGEWARRQLIPVPTARAVQWQVLSSVSALSSLSLQAAVPGQIPVHVSKPSFTINSSRILSAGFEGFTVQVGGSLAAITMPPALFGAFDGTVPDSFEVMMVLYNFADNPLPDANGPQISFEIRAFGSSVPLLFETPSTNPIVMLMPYVNVTRTKFPITGNEQVPFGKVFDQDSWSWITDTFAITEEQPELVRMQLFATGSHFAVGEVLASCDGIALGPKVKDQCGVCGGNDGTCSGCDGVPGTGRFKNCSGHGECEDPNSPSVCRCVADYFDISCATYCSQEVTCSGHGVCDFSTGKFCFCSTGWSSADGVQPTYPGPFCSTLQTTGGVGGVAGEDGKLSSDTIQWLLTYILPAVAGGLLLCLAVVWYATRRKRVLSELHRTIIEFPQPQLEVPAEARPDAIIAAPDEKGWTNMQLPAATADFGYGPNSGQLASAIAASTRTSIGQMSVQRIDRRTKIMKDQIDSKKTPAKYSGPRLFENGNGETNGHHELRESDEESDEENGEMVSTLQINHHPEWSNGKH